MTAGVPSSRALAPLATFPIRIETRRALVGEGDLRALVAVVEGDPGLALHVLRMANRSSRRGTAASARQAIEAMGAGAIVAVAEAVPAFDAFSVDERWGTVPERLRLHAVRVRSLVERL